MLILKKICRYHNDKKHAKLPSVQRVKLVFDKNLLPNSDILEISCGFGVSQGISLAFSEK